MVSNDEINCIKTHVSYNSLCKKPQSLNEMKRSMHQIQTH